MDQAANRIGTLNTVIWLLFLGSLFMVQQDNPEFNYASLALIGGGFVFSIIVNSKFNPTMPLLIGRFLNSIACVSIMGLTIYMSRGESHSMFTEILMWLLVFGATASSISGCLIILKTITATHKHV